MDKYDLVERVNVMACRARSDEFKGVPGRAFFLSDAESLLHFLDSHRIENNLNASLHTEIKLKFTSLIERRIAHEKKP